MVEVHNAQAIPKPLVLIMEPYSQSHLLSSSLAVMLTLPVPGSIASFVRLM